MKTLNKILLILILISFSKCESDSVKKIEFTDDVVVILSEGFSDTKKKEFSIRFVPLQNCHCLNEGILNLSYVRYGHSFDFKIKNIQIPDDCNDSYGSPYAEINMGALQNGEYNIQVNISAVNNSGILTVTDTAYCLTMTQKNIDLRGSHYRRIFENTLWGAFSYNTESELNTGLSLIDSLIAYGAQPTTLEDGDYSFFSINNGKAIKPLTQIVPHLYVGKEIAFVFDYNFDDEKFKNLLTKYTYTSGDLYIMVRTGKGFSFYNWR